MAEKKENIITHAMYAGLVLGGLLVACVALSLTIFAKSWFMLKLLDIAGLVIPFYCIFHFTKQFNKEVLEGKISYMSALCYGFYMFFFALMIFGLFAFIYFQYINPDFLAQSKDTFLSYFKQMDLPAEAVKEYEKTLAQVATPTVRDATIGIFWMFSLGGFVLSLFTSFFFLRKKDKTVDN